MAKIYKKTKLRFRKKVYRRKKPSLQRQLMRIHETKYQLWEDLSEPLTSGTPIVVSPTQMVAQGNTNTTRVGDSIYLQALRVTGFLTSGTIANAAQKYRILVFWSKVTTTAVAWASPGFGTDMFLNGTYGIVVNGIINPKAVTILADMVVDINCFVSGAAEVKSFAFNVPLNTKFDYQTPGGSLGKTKNLYLAVIPYSAVSGAVGAAGYIATSLALKFKDP